MIMCVLLCYPVSIRIYYQQGGLFLVNFLLDLDIMIQSNYQRVITKIENIISIYKARILSLIGKKLQF